MEWAGNGGVADLDQGGVLQFANVLVGDAASSWLVCHVSEAGRGTIVL